MQTQVQTSSNNEIQKIKKLIVKILLNWYWLVLAGVSAYTYAYLKTRFMPVEYQVSATVMLTNLKKTSNPLKIFEDVNFNQKNPIQDEIGILKSYFLNKKAIEELDFDVSYVGVGRSGYKKVNYYKNAPFKVILDTTKYTRLNYPIYLTVIDENTYHLEINDQYELSRTLKFGEAFNHPNFNFTIHLNEPEKASSYSKMGQFYFVLKSKHQLINAYRSKLRARLVDPGGSILSLSTIGDHPEQEVDYLNKIISVYTQYGLDESNLKATKTIQFIDKQLSQVKDSLRQAERALFSYKMSTQVVGEDFQNMNLLKEIADIQKELFKLDLVFEYMKELKLSLNIPVNDIIMLPINDLYRIDQVTPYIESLNNLTREKKLTTYNLKENNPKLTLLNHKINLQQREVVFFINQYLNALKSNKNEYVVKLNSLEKKIHSLPYEQRTMMSLQKNYDLYLGIHDMFLEKRTEAQISKASNVPSARVLDGPMSANARVISSNPKSFRQRTVMIGILIPVLIILLLEFLSNKIKDISEISKNSKIPVIAVISHVKSKEDLKIFENSRTPIAESFRILRTNLRYLLAEEKNKVITVTSSISGEGKSFSSLNLAAIYSFSGKKTLLVGLDIRKPKVHEYFGVSNKKGISSYLANHAKYEDVIKTTDQKNFYICPSGPVPPNPVELIESDLLNIFFERARKEFDIIIVDTPPIAVVADGIQISSFADINLFIVRMNYTNKGLLNLLNDLNTDKNIKNLYMVVNDVKTSDYYGYGHYNYYKHGYYYTSTSNKKKKSIRKKIKKLLNV